MNTLIIDFPSLSYLTSILYHPYNCLLFNFDSPSSVYLGLGCLDREIGMRENCLFGYIEPEIGERGRNKAS